MDQIDNQLNSHLQQQLPTHLNYAYRSNCKRQNICPICSDCKLFLIDQYFPTSNDENTSSPIAEHEQDDNDQMPMPIVYKKRVRTKFTQEQVRRNDL